ncbi:Cof-type HAD-IIB family hydrolase [Enterococcus sp.]|uniref:Cof-type HAD-IIB family hydrolase n=1 Tax=Enterococcus sp. TaxID=35783 RepID=UPI003C72875E
MIKLIASDMDGTLLDNDMQISPENVAAIKEAQVRGIEFIVATGRNREEAVPALSAAGINCAMVTLNGAHVFDSTGQSLFIVPIPYEEACRLFDLLESRGIYFEVFTNQGLYSENQEERIQLFAEHIAEIMPHLTHKMAIAMTAAHLEQLPIIHTENIRQTLLDEELEVLKIICFHNEGPAILGPVAAEIDRYGDLVVTSSGTNNLEINHKNAQKGIAVAHIAKDRGIDLADVMTIGDNLNDLSMIQLAGVSFAMENAHLELKENAKYHTDSYLNSGVGKAILRAINEEL